MINKVKEELEKLVGLPAEIDEKAREPQCGIDFVTDEQVQEFERRAKGVLIDKFMKTHRQQVAFQALRHTFIETKDFHKRAWLEHYFMEHPEYKDANRVLRIMRDELNEQQKDEWRRQMVKIIEVMHPSLKIRIDGEGRLTASFLSLMVGMPVVGLPIGDRGTIARQVREAVADIAPGFAD